MSSYTHGHQASVLRSHATRTAASSAAYLLPRLRPGQQLLDVGSGAGTITADLAGLVAPGGLTAVETSETVLAVTAAELERRGVSAELVVGDVHQLALADDRFDVSHAHQVLQHLSDPVQALRELIRVTRPGGTVAVRDADYGGFTWWPRLPELDAWRELYTAVARGNGGEPDAGRRLLGWARHAGAVEVVPSASTWCFADPAGRRSWGGDWAERVVSSALADHALAQGHCEADHLAWIAAGWRRWAEHPDGWFAVLHGELLITV